MPTDARAVPVQVALPPGSLPLAAPLCTQACCDLWTNVEYQCRCTTRDFCTPSDHIAGRAIESPQGSWLSFFPFYPWPTAIRCAPRQPCPSLTDFSLTPRSAALSDPGWPYCLTTLQPCTESRVGSVPNATGLSGPPFHVASRSGTSLILRLFK